MLIGKRTFVNLTEIWPRETEFSDWLASEEGLSLIAQDIGIEVENPHRESRPGDFRCDIVGNALGDENHIVVIENQYNKTDHDHLGKLLTYAAMHTATTCIWVSERISDDHRKVMDWLNDNTPPTVSFYLAQIKAYRIGQSPVAPQLDVVCRPNLEVKVRREGEAAELKERHIWRKEFWGEILGYIKSQNPPFSVQSPSTDHWTTIAVGRSNFYLNLLLVPRTQTIRCEFVAQPSWKDAAFAQLQAQQEDIEREIGEPLQWQSLPNIKRARIFLEAPLDPRDPENREAVKEWMYQQSLAFHRAFQPRVARLTAPALTNSIEESAAEENESGDSVNGF